MSLNRKAMVLAVGTALAAPAAYAQVTSKAGSEWEFYGKFYPEYARISGDSPSPVGTTVSTLSAAATGTTTLVNRNEMLVGNTYIGFRGGKSLGRGMKAIWQARGLWARLFGKISRRKDAKRFCEGVVNNLRRIVTT